MATEKITVKKCSLKKKTETYSIFTVELEDGRKGDTFTEMKEGQQYDVEATNDEKYGWKFTVAKQGGGKFGGKGYSPNLKLEAMKLAVDLVIGEAVKVEQLIQTADKVHAYIKS